MRAVAGMLKSDYRYSKDMVYNTFPFPIITQDQRNRISKSSQIVLDTRKLYRDSSLAELYDPLTMPHEKAHRNLDKEVCKAYGTLWKSEEVCVADLMKLYQELIDKKANNEDSQYL